MASSGTKGICTAKLPRHFKKQTRSASSSEKGRESTRFSSLSSSRLRVLAVQFFVLPDGQRRHEGNLHSEVAQTPSLRREELQETNEIRVFIRKETAPAGFSSLSSWRLRVLAVQFFVLPAGQRRHEGNLNGEVAKTPSLRHEELQETNDIRVFIRNRTGIGALFVAVIFASSRLGCSILRSSRWPAAARRESAQRSCQDAKSKTRRTSRDKRDPRLHPKRDRPGRLFFAVILASSRLGCSILRSSRWPAAARRESEQRSCQDTKSKTRRSSRDKRDPRLHPKRDCPGRLFFAVIFASWLFNSSFFPLASGGTKGI